MKIFILIGDQLPFTCARVAVHIIQFLPNKRIAPAVFPTKARFPNFVTFFLFLISLHRRRIVVTTQLHYLPPTSQCSKRPVKGRC